MKPRHPRGLGVATAAIAGLVLISTLLVLGAPRLMAETPAAVNPDDKANKAWTYPQAKKSDHVDVYHDVKVPDPYRWLENPDSEESQKWIKDQNAITFKFLESIPQREKIRARLTKLWNYERFGIPRKKGPHYFYSKNNGLQNQSVLYATDSLDGEPRVLIDPNTLSADGTVALAGQSVNHSGKLMAYGLAASGSDWNEWRIRDVASGKDLDDRLEWIKFSGASWSKDDQGFAYTRYPQPDPKAKLEQANYYAKLYYHKVGTKQTDDLLIYETPDHKDWRPNGQFTDDGKYLVITMEIGTDSRYRVYYKDLSQGLLESKAVHLVGEFDHDYSFIDNDGPLFWFRTNNKAPRGRLIGVDVRKPQEADWKEILPQTAETLEGASVINDMFAAVYLKDARNQVKIFDLDGKFVREVELPGIGSTSGFSGERTDKETFYAYTGFASPGAIYRYDMTTGQSRILRQPKVDFNPDDYVTNQIFYKSKDGTKVPMFITHKKGLARDGDRPTYLYGYGGFNISLTPSFSPGNLVWMEMGGVLAIPNLRGGGEYGEEWHQGGTKLKKQNVFDDFIAAAETLVKEKYTRKEKLAIGGGSNGGLLVGACMTQRPDLFGAALPAVGVMDMLRFHKFTIGWAWCDDYGSSDNPAEFKALLAYSPLHNVKKGVQYPPTLVTTADHDDRVVPAHSFKFAATLQDAQAGDNPTLIRIETKAGHGAGKPTSKMIEEAADKWAFLLKTLAVE